MLRLCWVALVVGIASLWLFPCQWIAVRTGWIDPHWPPRLWYRILLWALGWKVRHQGRMTDQRPLLVVSNHVSWSDIAVLRAQSDVVFVSKAEVARWPLIGWLAKLQRTIFVDRERRGRSAEQAGELAARFREGEAVVLFPEGTTADGNHLLPFKSALFGALALGRQTEAARSTIVVQPAAIAYTRLYGLPMGRWERNVPSWIGERSIMFHLRLLSRSGPLDVEVRWGALLAVDVSNRKAVALAAEESIRGMMAAMLRE